MPFCIKGFCKVLGKEMSRLVASQKFDVTKIGQYPAGLVDWVPLGTGLIVLNFH